MRKTEKIGQDSIYIVGNLQGVSASCEPYFVVSKQCRRVVSQPQLLLSSYFAVKHSKPAFAPCRHRQWSLLLLTMSVKGVPYAQGVGRAEYDFEHSTIYPVLPDLGVIWHTVTLQPICKVHGYKVFWHESSGFGWSQSDICILVFVGPWIDSGSSKVLNRPHQPKT